MGTAQRFRPYQERRRVLVVDDDSALRDVLVEGLAKRGFEVMAAEDGIDAFDLMERTGPPHAVVLDLSMPGMNGWEFLEELRDDPDFARVAVIVLTACPDARVPDADAFIVKPASLDEIERALADEVDHRPEEAP